MISLSSLAGNLTGKLTDRALGLPPAAGAYSVHRNQPVPMPDGVTLLGDHYRPGGTDEPLPVVLIRSPYGRAGIWGLVYAAPMARRGFQVFIQSTRGTFGSGGQFRPFTTETEDGLATVAWLRAQPWCDGRISTTGPSYLGHTQWALAPYVDPPLESVSLDVTAAEITLAFYDHHAPGLRNALSWSATIGTQERSPLSAAPTPRKLARMRRALRRRPLQALDVDMTGAPVAFWRDFVDHAEPGDPFWKNADHHATDLTRLPPVSMVTGWWDLFLAGQIQDFTRIRAAGVNSRITIGPWIHGEPAELKAAIAQNLAWLDHHLNGADRPAGASVRVFLQQADRWLDFPEWPPPNITPVAHHLRAGGGLDPEPEPAEIASTGFTYDPDDPTPTVGGPLLQPPGKQADNAAVEARDDVLTWTSRLLATDLDLVGPVSARIFVRLDGEHGDVFVRVCDVDRKGVSRNIVDGIRRLSPATVPAPDVEVGADGVLAVDVALFPTGYRLHDGHRIRVQVSGGAFPRFARNPGTGEPLGSATGGRRVRFEILHDAQHPSHLTLPTLKATP